MFKPVVNKGLIPGGKALNLQAFCLKPSWGLFEKPSLEVLKLFAVKFDICYVASYLIKFQLSHGFQISEQN